MRESTERSSAVSANQICAREEFTNASASCRLPAAKLSLRCLHASRPLYSKLTGLATTLRDHALLRFHCRNLHVGPEYPEYPDRGQPFCYRNRWGGRCLGVGWREMDASERGGHDFCEWLEIGRKGGASRSSAAMAAGLVWKAGALGLEAIGGSSFSSSS